MLSQNIYADPFGRMSRKARSHKCEENGIVVERADKVKI